MRWDDIDWTRRVIFVRHSYTVDADGPRTSGKVWSVPIVDQAGPALDQPAGVSAGHRTTTASS